MRLKVKGLERIKKKRGANGKAHHRGTYHAVGGKAT